MSTSYASQMVGQYHLMSPFTGCDGTMTGWQVYSDDDGAPDGLVADFAHEEDARLFCAANDLAGVVAEYLEAIHNLAPEWLTNQELVEQAETAWALVERARRAREY